MRAELPVLEAVLFDLDGTLVDSEPNYHEADKIFLAHRSIRLPEHIWPSVVGIGSETFIDMLRRDYGLTGDAQTLLEEKNRVYLEQARENTRAFPEMLAFVRACRDAGLKTAVASGSSPLVIRKSLEWAGLEGYFDLLLSAEEVNKGKPEPDIFLEAARRLGVSEGACLVIEDAKPGVIAAKAAGMRCVAIPSNPHLELDPAFLSADHLFAAGMPEFRSEGLVSLLVEAGVWPE